jgi:hypothetical protein
VQRLKSIRACFFFADSKSSPGKGFVQSPSWVLMPQVREITLRLATAGHAVLVGHGVTIVTAKLSNVYHVRLTGSQSSRIERVQKIEKLTPEAASTFVKARTRSAINSSKPTFTPVSIMNCYMT